MCSMHACMLNIAVAFVGEFIHACMHACLLSCVGWCMIVLRDAYVVCYMIRRDLNPFSPAR